MIQTGKEQPDWTPILYPKEPPAPNPAGTPTPNPAATPIPNISYPSTHPAGKPNPSLGKRSGIEFPVHKRDLWEVLRIFLIFVPGALKLECTNFITL